LDDDIPQVLLDPEEMRYVLQCLLENALEAVARKRASRPGAAGNEDEIVLRLEADPTKERTVLLSVRDTGPGFDLELLPHVFNRFSSTKEQDFRRGKHGLGLWEAKRLVEHEEVKGEIKTLNLAAGGAEVQMRLPALPTATATDEWASAEKKKGDAPCPVVS
jgi:signal transduction histidine kinase